LKILDTVLSQGISKRIKLSAGDKIKGSLEAVSSDLCKIIIYRLGEKHWWGEEKEVVYESPWLYEIGRHWDVLFEVLEDGEYLIEVISYGCCYKVQLYLERGDKTVVY